MFNEGISPYFLIEHIEKYKLNFMYTKSVPFIAKKSEMCGNYLFCRVCSLSGPYRWLLYRLFLCRQAAQCSPPLEFAFSTGPPLLNQNMSVNIRVLRVIFRRR